ncbi:hypothetical protein Tco_0992633 [Tanacetum coccineum]|uniref:Reverse transcriptase domain-containing protein n=1 Tax=Tanacetum coccineum TaxID=301880 RepID=A0ABQ5F3H0_9ASTR
MEGTRTGSREGPSEPAQLAQKTHSPTFIMENIDVLRTMMKEHDQLAKAKATPKKLIYNDFEEEGSIPINRGLIQAIPTSLPPQPIGEATKAFNVQRIAPGDPAARKHLSRPTRPIIMTSRIRDRARSSEKSQRSLSRSKTSSHLRRYERLGNKNKSKAKAREGKTKSGGRRSEHKGISSDSDCGGRFGGYLAKLPRNVKVYEDSKDLEDHLGIISIAAEQEEWPIPKRYVKDSTKIHGIKRRMDEGLQAFMDRFKSKSTHQGCVTGATYLGIHVWLQTSRAGKKAQWKRPYWMVQRPGKNSRKKRPKRVQKEYGDIKYEAIGEV